MVELAAPDYTFARFVLERGIAAIYVIAFVVAARQFPALCGEHGLEPAATFMRHVPFRRGPSLFYLRFSDRLVTLVSWLGATVALSLVLGLAQRAPLPVTMLAWLLLWVLYQSIVNVGGTFYGFGWETLLLEAGFLAIFLGNDAVAPPWLLILAFRWLAFRVEFGAGLIKLRGDPCWKRLRCMDYHQETQPLPNPLSWLAHRVPRPWHTFETFGNFVAQLVLPFGLVLPQPFATAAAILMIGTQFFLVTTGNYAWLNWLTMISIVAGISDSIVNFAVPAMPAATAYPPTPAWFTALVIAVAIAILVLSYWPARNLISPNQAMNASFNPLHLVNTYGAFGAVSRERIEVIVEGTASEVPDGDAEWLEYGFKAKPGDVRRMPSQVAPYHLRLDWLMWFIPLSPRYAEGWFVVFLMRLLEGDGPTLRLLGHNPFPDRPPVYVRARFFRYRYTTWRERRETGAWWTRTFVGDLVPPSRLHIAEDSGARPPTSPPASARRARGAGPRGPAG